MSDDDLEFEGMTEAQIDAQFARMMQEFQDSIDAMTPKQRYEYRRRRRLDLCRRQRKLIRDYAFDFMREHLKATQRRLLEARIEYRTGVEVGQRMRLRTLWMSYQLHRVKKFGRFEAFVSVLANRVCGTPMYWYPKQERERLAAARTAAVSKTTPEQIPVVTQ